jgi:hypothetical protein
VDVISAMSLACMSMPSWSSWTTRMQRRCIWRAPSQYVLSTAYAYVGVLSYRLGHR